MTRSGLLPLHALLFQFQIEQSKERFRILFSRLRLGRVEVHRKENCK